MKSKIFYTKPSITRIEEQFVVEAINNGWGENCYAFIDRFERGFSKFVGSKYAVATSSCTGAIQLGLSAIGVGKGDEVIVADTNWVASVAPIVHLGATPVFVDISEKTWCIDPLSIEAAITDKTKAILAVHLYGNMCEMEALSTIAQRYGLMLIEDSAEAIGSYWDGHHAGTIGEFGVFSFHGSKTITTGEGGILVTNNETLFNKVRLLNNHGRSHLQKKQFWPDEIGYKFRMSNVDAAIGCAQLQRIDELVKRKEEIFIYYYNALHHHKQLALNSQYEKSKSGYWMPTVVFSRETGLDRNAILNEFLKENIDARVFFYPLSSTGLFKSECSISNPNSYNICNRAINLPSYHDITTDEQDRVIEVVQRLLHRTNQ